jgi:hypothetical protein
VKLRSIEQGPNEDLLPNPCCADSFTPIGEHSKFDGTTRPQLAESGAADQVIAVSASSRRCHLGFTASPGVLTPVPEAESWALLLAGVVALRAAVRKRRGVSEGAALGQSRRAKARAALNCRPHGRHVVTDAG